LHLPKQYFRKKFGNIGNAFFFDNSKSLFPYTLYAVQHLRVKQYGAAHSATAVI